MTISPGAALRDLRERRPLVHQITNYVVMNETANATLALGALPVMAHAPQEVEEMARVAGALVLNIGTLSEPWVEAMLLAGRAANEAGVPVVLDPVGAGATRYRTETARLLLDGVVVAVVRGNPAEVATLAGREAEIRGVESIGAGGAPADLARGAARALGCVAAVTGPVDHVSDGEQVVAIANGHELLASVTGTGCISTALTGCFLAVRPALEAAVDALVALGVAAEDAAEGARRPGHLPRAALRRAGGARSGDPRRAREVDLHVLVTDLEVARRAVEEGATVVQLRLKGAGTRELVERGRSFRALAATLVVNDDVDAAIELGADGVHLGRSDTGAERALEAALLLGLSASSVEEAKHAEYRGAAYVGAGPVWTTPSKEDADPAIGLDGLRAICESVSIPVVAIGGVDASNAGRCIRTGAAGIAVIRAAAETKALRQAIDAAR